MEKAHKFCTFGCFLKKKKKKKHFLTISSNFLEISHEGNATIFLFWPYQPSTKQIFTEDVSTFPKSHYMHYCRVLSGYASDIRMPAFSSRTSQKVMLSYNCSNADTRMLVDSSLAEFGGLPPPSPGIAYEEK